MKLLPVAGERILMNTKRWGFASLPIAAIAGFIVGAQLQPTQSFAQVEKSAAASPGRFQISAWAFATPDRRERGCYIVDGATGELWTVRADGAAKKISEPLK